MRLNDSSVGSTLLEVMVFFPLVLLGVAVGAEGSRIFETRSLVTTALREALAPQHGSRTADTPGAVVERLSLTLASIGSLQLSVVDATFAVDPRSGSMSEALTLNTATIGPAIDTPMSLTHRALAPFKHSEPHPFAVPLTFAADAPPLFRERMTVRVVAIRLTPHSRLTPLLSPLLRSSFRVETLLPLPTRGGF